MNDKDKDISIENLREHFRELFNIRNDGTKSEDFSEKTDVIQDSNENDDYVQLKKIEQFSLRPREIRDYLNRFVIKQEEAKKVLSVAISDHYNHVRECLKNPKMIDQDYSKQNILLLGPTGVGKTYLIRTIAKLIGVPFVKADATKFSETGYVGNDVDDIVRDLVKSANGSTQLARFGIVYIDEIDKIASVSGSTGKDVSGRGVQINLLKLMEDTEVNLLSTVDMISQMNVLIDMNGRSGKPKDKTINTRHILFIVSGAFDKLAESVKKRVDHSNIGFGSFKNSNTEDISMYLHKANTRDFIDYGFEPEFIGRLPIRVACESLNKEDLSNVLRTSEGSILNQYKNDFRGYQIEMNVTSEAIDKIAELAEKEQTGARGLMTVLEKILRNFKFDLPSMAINQFELTTEVIENPEKALKEFVLKNKHLEESILAEDLKRFAESFKLEHELSIKFSEDAIEFLVSMAVESGRTIHSICQEKFKDFHFGLKIISRNTGQEVFLISRAIVENPDKELSDLVVQSFKNKS